MIDQSKEGVIRGYRECHMSNWPCETTPGLSGILNRLASLYPMAHHGVQTHLLHLASTGEILPHVDNIESSGKWILGVSLGASRIMRMTPKAGTLQEGNEAGGEILLESGSVYIQSNSLRYDYEHSILKGGPRVSIIVRVRASFVVGVQTK